MLQEQDDEWQKLHLVRSDVVQGDLYARASHIEEVEVDILSVGPSWSERERELTSQTVT